MEIKVASVDSIIIYFSDFISEENSYKVKAAYKVLKNLNNNALIEIIPSYTSILVTYDVFEYNFDEIKKYIETQLETINYKNEKESKILEVDVYYGEEVGLDLQRVAKNSNISIEELIEIHSYKLYDVYAIGFLPGFAFMASVDDKIATARLESPRKSIPKGSVAIADNQTAVYPQSSPGGWNILGRTMFEFFDKNLEELSPVTIDSKIKFNSISKEEFISQGGII